MKRSKSLFPCKRKSRVSMMEVFCFAVLFIAMMAGSVLAAPGDFLFKWGSLGAGDGQFYNPMGVAVDKNGDVYVSDSYNHRIQVFTSDGTFIKKWGALGTGDGQFSYPMGLALNNNGDVYVTEYGNHRIQVLASDGTFIRKWGSYGSGDGQFNGPEGIAVAKNGDVYVSDSYNHRIQVFTSNGTFIRKWGSYGSGDSQFYFPIHISLDKNGNVYVAESYNHRVQVFTSDGTFIRKWGSYGTGEGQFRHPTGMALDKDDNVFVTELVNNRVQVFKSDGTFIKMWGWGVATGASIFETCTGSCLSGNPGSGDGQFIYPQAVAVDNCGTKIYVSEVQDFGGHGWGGTHRIQAFEGFGVCQIDPVPDIKANGSDGPVTVTQNDNLSVTIALDDGDFSGDNADWWVLADTPFGCYYYNLSSGWQPGMTVTYQGPLFDLSTYEVLSASGLPLGSYT
ncbi:hypothetical protein HY772_07840, partial [Candidatus Woesearchaeota archaeon]|nr:hypothetical protein [Candidatus Woesearchaeota archaeon]